jgi:hypothetical protein
MSVIDGSRMSTFGPKSGSVPAGAPEGGHPHAAPSAAASGIAGPESGFAGPPEELPVLEPASAFVPLLEAFVPPLEEPELEPELEPEPPPGPASTAVGQLSGVDVEEQAAMAAAAALREKITAPLAPARLRSVFFALRRSVPPGMARRRARLLPLGVCSTIVSRRGELMRLIAPNVHAASSGLRKPWLCGPVCGRARQRRQRLESPERR